MAGAKAIFTGLQAAKEQGYTKVVMESDSLQAIQALQTGVGDSSDFHLVLDDILALVPDFESVKFSFVKRAGNSVVHALAHLQPMEMGKRWWEDDFPNSIVCLAANDLID